VPENNQQEKTNDPVFLTDREVWAVIRYLDPEPTRRDSDIAALIILLAIIIIGGIVCLLLYLRGL
jgi:hypothetical protein